MDLVGHIIRLQIQRSSLKLGDRPRRWFDPSPMLEVPALSLSPDGAVGLPDGQPPIIDVHNREHPRSRHGTGNGISVGFTTHYAHMRDRFGDVVTIGLAGENILVDTTREFIQSDLPANLILETEVGLIHLQAARVIEPCVEFSRYLLGHRGPPPHDLPTPADHDAAVFSRTQPADQSPSPGAPDPKVKETLIYLRRGMRGYVATYTSGPTTLRLGARLYLP
jgi:hypothetical protein